MKDSFVFLLVLVATVVNFFQAQKIWALEERVKKLEPAKVEAPTTQSLPTNHAGRGTE